MKKRQKRGLIKLIVVAMLVLCYYFFVEEHNKKGLDYKVKQEIVNRNYFESNIRDAELPAITDSTFFVRSEVGRYSYYYQPQYALSSWVAYRLTREDLEVKPVKRSTTFRKDETVLSEGWHSASNEDYYRSSFNKGHLVPSSDRLATREENRATFSFANIAPQTPRLNSGIWLMIENKVKEWAYAYGEAIVVAGSIIEKPNRYIGENRVAVPSHFYKCVVVFHKEKWYGIGFVVPNSNKLSKNYNRYSCTIDEVEKIINADLFPNIENVSKKDFEGSVYKSIFK